MSATGKVWLVGAGPGDAGLLTVKGAELLAAADTVVYDRLVSPALLAALPPAVKLIDAGKSGGHPQQDEINRLLIAEASAGKKVVRLKGGDPFLFGRGAEEFFALNTAGIFCEVVPGVSSALAAPAAAGIPVTHRGVSSSLHIITWHHQDGNAPDLERLRGLVNAGGTVVILMAAAGKNIGDLLIRAGFAPDTPAAIIENGTTLLMRTRRLTLADFSRAMENDPPQSPALVAVGEVCQLDARSTVQNSSDEARRGENRLAGARIVVTRPEPQNAAACREIRARGGIAIPLPLSRRVPLPVDGQTLLAAANYAWLVFTAAAGVAYFFAAYFRAGDIRRLANCRFAAVGATTAAALRGRGFIADYVAERANGRDLGEHLPATAAEKILLIRGKPTAAGLDEALRERGLIYDELAVYENVPLAENDTTRRIIAERNFAFVFFASPLAVKIFTDRRQKNATDFSAITALCIGETTAAAARETGMTAHAAPETSLAGLCRLAAELMRPLRQAKEVSG
ncbi:MAG: uroporphyrinogen-III C-methyltransferase [Planctomycetota bacterium]|nr:uroporphyrinogen-III C-methyltransferase [Planctomycetota bacterium]